jgi:hypothetical protein
MKRKEVIEKIQEKKSVAMKAQQEIAIAVLECVPDSGVPDGHLYASLMQYMSLDVYQRIMAVFLSSQVLVKQNHYLMRGPRYATALGNLTQKEI